MEITEGKNQRGFRYNTFTDRYGAKCSIQKSSLAFEDAIWFGCDELGLKKFTPHQGWEDIEIDMTTHVANTRMHLTQQMVKDLLPTLQYFAETGELPPIDD